jgi:hypothetical protein
VQTPDWSTDKSMADFRPENMRIMNGLSDRQVNEKVVERHWILQIPRSAGAQRENVNYVHFKRSFESRVKNFEERMKLMPLFSFLSKGLESVKIVESLVDVSVKQRMIEFNLNMGGDVCVSVQKTLDTMEDDNVIFTVSLDGVLRTADCLPMILLQDKLLQLQHVIEESKSLS